MPTGYTAKLSDQEQPFNEFIMTCARAMGACVMMREEPFDAPIPEMFEPSDYHAKAIKKAKEWWDAVVNFPIDRCEKEAQKAYQKRLDEISGYIAKAAARNQRYEEMADKVKAWNPPTKDHEGLKEFMLEQLRISMDSTNYHQTELDGLKKLAGVDWRASQLAATEKDIAYHQKEHDKEIERTSGRNEWISSLRESLEALEQPCEQE